MSRPVESRPRRVTGDPYGLSAARPYLAPLIALIGLLVVAFVSFGLLTGSIKPPITGNSGTGTGTNGGGTPPPNRTPSPSASVAVNPNFQVQGLLVYVKAGNIWIQSGNTTTQLTKTGRDSQPSWSADGKWIYFIETRETRRQFPPPGGTPQWYDELYPILSRISPDGKVRQSLQSGLYRSGPGRQWTWFYFIRQPAVSPNGRQVAVVSDGPDPTRSDVVLQLYDTAKKKMTSLGLAEQPPYGHQDPAWSPDGSRLLYVKNMKGGPVIFRYDPGSKHNAAFTSSGYMQPIYSPNGRFIAAVITNNLGTDVVVLDARNGAEISRITSDGRSWAPSWSPDGTELAFLHLSGLAVDVKVATLQVTSNGDVKTTKVDDLTEFSGLDGNSRPAWWGPPSATPSPAASSSTSTSPSPSATGQ